MGMSQASQRDQRVAFRVVIGPDDGLVAHLVLAGKKYRAEVGDVSAEGMFIKLQNAPARPLKVDTMVDIEVALGREKFVLFGLVRSQHSGGYGLFFPERDPAGRFNPLGRFSRIVLKAQRAVLTRTERALRPWHQ